MPRAEPAGDPGARYPFPIADRSLLHRITGSTFVICCTLAVLILEPPGGHQAPCWVRTSMAHGRHGNSRYRFWVRVEQRAALSARLGSGGFREFRLRGNGLSKAKEFFEVYVTKLSFKAQVYVLWVKF